MTEQMIDVPHGRLRARSEGAGVPMVLLHAGIARLEAWDAMTVPLVEAGYRVIRYDQRGFGESVSDDVEFFPVDDLVAVLAAFDVDRAVLVGNSYGGMVALDAALAHPTRVVAAVGVGSGLAGYDGSVTEVEMDLWNRIEALEGADPPDADAIAELEVQLWVDGPGQPPGRAAAATRDAVREWSRALNAPDHPRSRHRWLVPDAGEDLGRIAVPTLMVAGALDVGEVRQLAEQMAAASDQVTAVVWDDVAHMVGMEQPTRLAAEIVRFVSGRSEPT